MIIWYDAFVRDWNVTKRINLIEQAFLLGLIEFIMEVMLVIKLLN